MSIEPDERIRIGRNVLGARIRHLRGTRGMTLVTVATAAGISFSYLSDVERGRRLPTLEVLDTVAVALGTTVVALLRGLYPWDLDELPASTSPPPDGRRRVSEV